jgi:L-alanine-DL-glutamate epimerase-like enolase superfamily enzyme
VTIRAVHARPLDLELAAPMETAAGLMRTAPVVLVDLETDEGVTGRGYVRTFTPVALGALAQLLSDLEDVVAGLPVSSHAFPELSVHLLGATPTAHRLEYLDHFAPLLAEPVRIENGYALAPDRPGIGLEWKAR